MADRDTFPDLIRLHILHHAARLTRTGFVNLVLVAVSVSALAAFVVTGAPRMSGAHLTPFAPQGVRGTLSAASVLLVAYAGYGRIATMSEEVRNPGRNIPLALVTALGLAAALYLGVTAVAVGSLGAAEFARAAREGAPLEAAAAFPWVRAWLSVGAATALGGVFLNLMLGLSRMAFAMARGGDLPAVLSRLNGGSSPFVSVLFVGATVGALVAFRNIVGLVGVSAFTVLVYYGLTNLSALRLSRPERLVHPAVPALGLAFCLRLAASVPPKQLAIGASILAAGAVWRLLWKAGRRPSRRG
jgi:APA family basic amino acid/polyamine antiporter